MSAPAGWLDDPTGRHQHRYWDGSAWTDHVSDSGTQSTDPIAAPPTDPAPAPAPQSPPTAATAPSPAASAPAADPNAWTTGPGSPPAAVATVERKKRKKWPWIAAGVVVLLIVVGVAAGGSGNDSKKTANTITTAPPAAPSAAATQPPTTVPAGPIFTQSGTGTATTAAFKVPNTWDLAWTYDCTGTFGGTGVFTVENYDLTGSAGGNAQSGGNLDFSNQGVIQLGAQGQGVEHYHSGGNTRYMKVSSSACPWTITVTKA